MANRSIQQDLKDKRDAQWPERSMLLPIYKNKGDVQDFSTDRGIKLISYTMKLWSEWSRYGFGDLLPYQRTIWIYNARSTMEAIHLMRQIEIEKYMNDLDLQIEIVENRNERRRTIYVDD